MIDSWMENDAKDSILEQIHFQHDARLSCPCPWLSRAYKCSCPLRLWLWWTPRLDPPSECLCLLPTFLKDYGIVYKHVDDNGPFWRLLCRDPQTCGPHRNLASSFSRHFCDLPGTTKNTSLNALYPSFPVIPSSCVLIVVHVQRLQLAWPRCHRHCWSETPQVQQ